MARTTRRALLSAVGGGAAALAGCAGDDDGTPATTEPEVPSEFPFGSPAFEGGELIPVEYTCDGANRSPPLSVSPPDEAGTLALVVDDPDAPGGTFTHWQCWNVPADRAEIPAGIAHGETVPELEGARQGTNDLDQVGYGGPCPPAEDDAHTYRFTAHAVEGSLELSAGARTDALLDALEGRTLARSRFTGEYARE